MAFNKIARTPEPLYYAVVFTSERSEGDRGYNLMSEKMAALAAEQPGFLGAESARNSDGLGITVSYWESTEAIENWKTNAEHRIAQETGKKVWYSGYMLRIAKV